MSARHAIYICISGRVQCVHVGARALGLDDRDAPWQDERGRRMEWHWELVWRLLNKSACQHRDERTFHCAAQEVLFPPLPLPCRLQPTKATVYHPYPWTCQHNTQAGIDFMIICLGRLEIIPSGKDVTVRVTSRWRPAGAASDGLLPRSRTWPNSDHLRVRRPSISPLSDQ